MHPGSCIIARPYISDGQDVLINLFAGHCVLCLFTMIKENMKLFNVIMIIAASVNLAGCFSSNPSESDANKVVLEGYKQYIDSGDVVVDNVKKTNGMEMGAEGIKMYDMSVDITLKFPKGINCKIDLYKEKQDVDIYKCMHLKISGENIAPGTSKTSPRGVRFIKSENGWQGGLM